MKTWLIFLLSLTVLAFSQQVEKFELKTTPTMKGGAHFYRIENDSIEILKSCVNGETCDSSIIRNSLVVIDYRRLTASEKDTVLLLLQAANKKSGEVSYSCDAFDGYLYQIQSEKLSLKCRNCHSCKRWFSFGKNEYLKELGKYTCWLMWKAEKGRRQRPCWPE